MVISASGQSRRYPSKDLKKLFALSHNECAYPSCEQRLADEQWPKVMAEIAHVYGLNPGSARHDPTMSIEELNSYENLILLCPNHHLMVDSLEEEQFDAERLLEMKRSQEKRRRQRWTADDAVIEAAVRKLALTLNITVVAEARPPDEVPPHAPDPPTKSANSERKRSKNLRMHELATELGMTNAEIMALSDAMGVGAKNHSSTIIEQQADRLRRRAERDGLTRPVPPTETTTNRQVTNTTKP